MAWVGIVVAAKGKKLTVEYMEEATTKVGCWKYSSKGRGGRWKTEFDSEGVLLHALNGRTAIKMMGVLFTWVFRNGAP